MQLLKALKPFQTSCLVRSFQTSDFFRSSPRLGNSPVRSVAGTVSPSCFTTLIQCSEPQMVSGGLRLLLPSCPQFLPGLLGLSLRSIDCTGSYWIHTFFLQFRFYFCVFFFFLVQFLTCCLFLEISVRSLFPRSDNDFMGKVAMT